MENNLEEYLKFAKNIAKYAGKIMIKYFNKDNGSSYKGDKTIVTLADKEINTYLIEKVKEKYPNHSVDGEEEQFGKSDYVWVCDPVDGTAMYARNIPVAVFSLALVVNGEPKVGVVFDPFTNSLYTALKGDGAYKNGKKITVNEYGLDDMRTVCNCDYLVGGEYNISKVLEDLKKRSYFVGLGSVIRASICVASGDFTLAIFLGTKHKNCDIAAVKIIVEEAGGIVTDLFGNEQRYDRSINGAIISNGKVHNEVIEYIKKYLKDKSNN